MNDLNNMLNSNPTCVLATQSFGGAPQAATVGFSHDPTDMSFLIATNSATRKYKNLKSNPLVAIVVGTSGHETFQFEGVAAEQTAEDLGDRLSQHFVKVPAAQKYAGGEGQAYFVITPKWFRYSDLADPLKTFERSY